MTPADMLRLLWAVVEATHDGSPESWVTADEVKFQLYDRVVVGDHSTQQVASKLTALERRGLLESRRDIAWKSYRCARPLRDMLTRAAA